MKQAAISAMTICHPIFRRLLMPSDFFSRTFLKSSQNPSNPQAAMVQAQTATNGLSGRAKTSVEISTEPMMSTPPIVGVPIFPPWSSASLWTSAAVRIGWPTLSEIRRRITRGPKMTEMMNASSPALAARKVMYWKRFKNENVCAQPSTPAARSASKA